MLKLFNTLSRKKEIFKPLKGKEVGFYSCGPTVYDYAHIGNFRAYICSDILKRYLLYRKYKVKHVMNLTDVDDKTIKKSIEEKLPLKEVTTKYENAFFQDLEKLRITKATIFPKATEHIKEMVSLIQKLLDKGYAYLGEDGSIYYSVSKFKDYGKLSHFKIKELKRGMKRVLKDEYGKEEAQDFALWKAYSEEEGDVSWNAEFIIGGKKRIVKGRPGWHIECSAMSMRYLGESFDIHSGGTDLIFPHHENEIAQSEGATGKKFVCYWVHNGWLLVEGKKMSKSLGNFYTLRDLLEKGHDARAIKFELLSGHYRQQLDFTFDGLKAAKARIEKIDNFIRRLKEVGEEKKDSIKKQVTNLIKTTKKEFEAALDNDLDVPKTLEIFFRFIREVNLLIDNGRIDKESTHEVLGFLKEIDFIFGILKKEEKLFVPAEIKKIVDEREKARKEKDFKKSDALRNKLKEKGWWVDDTSKGPRIRKL